LSRGKEMNKSMVITPSDQSLRKLEKLFSRKLFFVGKGKKER